MRVPAQSIPTWGVVSWERGVGEEEVRRMPSLCLVGDFSVGWKRRWKGGRYLVRT